MSEQEIPLPPADDDQGQYMGGKYIPIRYYSEETLVEYGKACRAAGRREVEEAVGAGGVQQITAPKPLANPTPQRTEGGVDLIGSGPWRVAVIESERGWGQKVDEFRRFESYELASAWKADFNKRNTAATVPDWYEYAMDPEHKPEAS